MDTLLINSALTVICGPLGAGKTNFALNLVKAQAAAGLKVTLIDLDIVNPYFRSGNYLSELKSWGVRFLGPVHSGDNLDTPSLMPGIDLAIARASSTAPVVLDVGGDPEGARSLGRFKAQIESVTDRQVLFLLNFSLQETPTVAAAQAVLHQVEASSGLAFTALADNTHLKQFTDEACLERGLLLSRELAVRAGLPLVVMAVPAPFAQCFPAGDLPLWPLQVIVKANWE
ncbi:MAG: hypothetical protein LBL67_01290 [Coriobacteriales bacterium]|jgi:hypothetical protein|nr:hypothetical protein [Coriobacteriales bacterium]